MKKHIPTILTVIVIAIPAALLFIVFALPNLKYLTRATLTLDLDNVTRIELQSGMGMGFTATTETDPEVIDRITADITRDTFIKGEELPEYTGWSYRLKFYNGSTFVEELTVFSSDTLDYGGRLYTAALDSGVDADYLDELLYTALPLDELLTYGTQFVDDLLHDFPRERIVSLYGEPNAIAENGADIYHADDGSVLYVNYTDDKVSSVWIAHPAK